jgi:hypothetical protein
MKLVICTLSGRAGQFSRNGRSGIQKNNANGDAAVSAPRKQEIAANTDLAAGCCFVWQ